MTLVESRIRVGCFLIPRGMVPTYAHRVNNRWLVHVENSTAEKEYDPPFYFELHPLRALTRFEEELTVQR